MNPAFLRQRLIRIVTRPPELLYAMTRHWFLVFTFLVLAIGATWLVVSFEPVLYQARAQLLIKPAKPFADEEARAVFLPVHSNLLQSLPVLRDALKSIQPAEVQTSAESVPETINPILEYIPEDVRTALSRFVEKLTFTEAIDPTLNPETRLQKAVESFKNTRSSVLPRKGTDPSGVAAVDLTLLGKNRKRLVQEMNAWIDAYKRQVDILAGNVNNAESDHQLRVAQQLRDQAEEAIKEFRAQNPEVSPERRDDILREIERLRRRREDLREEMDKGAVTVDESSLKNYQQLVDMLESAINKAIVEGTPVTSQKFKRLMEALEHAKSGQTTADEEAVELAFAQRKSELETEIEGIGATLDKLYVDHDALQSKLRYREVLESNFNAANMRVEITQGNQITVDNARVEVIVFEAPVVDTQPYNFKPGRKMLLGSAAGLLLGCAFAVFFEILCGKVRFKHDVVADFGLPVVAVFPR